MRQCQTGKFLEDMRVLADPILCIVVLNLNPWTDHSNS